MTREEEVLKAFETIRSAIVDRMIYGPEGWDRKPNLLSSVVIRSTGIHSLSYDKDGGRDMGNGYSEGAYDISDYPVKITISDPTIAMKADRDKAQAEVLKIQAELEKIAKQKAEVQKKLDDLNNKLIVS